MAEVMIKSPTTLTAGQLRGGGLGVFQLRQAAAIAVLVDQVVGVAPQEQLEQVAERVL